MESTDEDVVVDVETTPTIPKDKEEPKKMDQVSNVRSTTSTIAPKERSCCYRFWNAIFKFFAHDSIYGSFVGPHPVSFLCCCCTGCCKRTCISPFALASIATKLMWFLMLVVIILLSCFFIIPYGKGAAEISDFYPCHRNKSVNNNLTHNCDAHGGYFMVYRNFFAFDLLLLISCFNMINVKSTGKNKKRAKMHHGFWMYKYIILFTLLLISYLAIRVEAGGVFEYVMSWCGLLAVTIFSFVEITFLLDLVELFCQKNRTSDSDWANFVYWIFCGAIILLDCTIIVLLCSFYGIHQYKDVKQEHHKEHNGPNLIHILILSYAIFLALCLFIFGIINMRRKQKLFKYTGMLQTSLVILYMLTIIWTALGNSIELTARPHYNVYGNNETSNVNRGNMDTYFKPEPCVHGLCSFFALVYYVFWHGPRTTTAPMSILFDKIFFCMAKKSEVPVIPVFDKKSLKELVNLSQPSHTNETSSENAKADLSSPNEIDKKETQSSTVINNPETTPELTENSAPKDSEATTAEKETQKDNDPEEEYATAIKEFKVWDDEKQGVRYSWSMFYIFMILGSLSIMMGMTAFSDPWAEEWFSSSIPALAMKLSIALIITLIYIVTTTFPCPKVYAEANEKPMSESVLPQDPEKGSSEPST